MEGMAKIDPTQPDDQFDLIEAWLGNELSEEAKQAVEARMAADPDFKDAVGKHKYAHQLLINAASANVKSQLEDLRKNNLHKSKKRLTVTNKQKLRLRWFTVAASILLFAIIGSWWWSWQNFSTKALITEYGVAYPAGPLRGNTQAETTFQQAMHAYSQKNYTEARQLFANIHPSDNNQIEISFYLGHTYFQLAEYENAITAYQKVIGARDIRFQAAAEWYYLLSLLGSEQEEQFQQMADKLAQDSQHAYRQQLINLQHDLSSTFQQLPGIK